jgi:hypothetical protein
MAMPSLSLMSRCPVIAATVDRARLRRLSYADLWAEGIARLRSLDAEAGAPVIDGDLLRADPGVARVLRELDRREHLHPKGLDRV